MAEKLNSAMKKAFSLLELAIVIVVIGLIVSIVSVSAKLTTTAKLNKIIKNLNKYDANLTSFHTIYGSYPGDFDSASSYWTGETDGNGDNLISGGEIYQTWRHLSLAGILSKNYNGTNQAPEFDSHDKVPAIILFYKHATIYNTSSSTLYLSSRRTVDYAWNGTIQAAKAYIIDKKIDDGNPSTGNIMAFNYNSSDPLSECAARTDTSVKVSHSYTGTTKYMNDSEDVGCTLLKVLTTQYENF